MQKRPGRFGYVSAALIFASLALFAGPAGAVPLPGELDPSFGSGGIVANNSGTPVDVAVQPDGKIVVAGKRETCPEGPSEPCESEFLVERYTAEGAPDISFGGGDGIVTTSFGAENEVASSVIVEADGKILVAGTAGGEFALARLDEDGALDTSFGGGTGKATASVPEVGALRSTLHSMALLPGGQIVLGASGYLSNTTEPEPWHMVLARFSSTGSLDPSFGNGFGTDIGPAGQLYGLTADGDGRPIATGRSKNAQFTVVRFRADGALDTTFAGTGQVTMDFNVTGSAADRALVEPDGKILVAGYGVPITLMRFDEDGSPDPSFGGGDGIVTPTFGDPCCAIGAALAVARQPDGRIVIAGQWQHEELKDEWAVGRLFPDGVTDNTFGTHGLTTVALDGGGYEDFATGMALQGDGNIVAVGTSGYPSHELALMRFLGGGNAPEASPRRLTVVNADPEDGWVSGPDMLCPYDCSVDYPERTTVELSASGEYELVGSEYVQVPFLGWKTLGGDPGTCTGTTTPCEVALSQDVELEARFGTGEGGGETPGGGGGGETPTGGGGGETPVGGTEPSTPSDGATGGSSTTATPAAAAPTSPSPVSSPGAPSRPKAIKCRKGTKKRVVHGTAKCVKVTHKQKHRRPAKAHHP